MWVARLGSFRAAADHLHITQAAMSNRIASLEQEIGARVFEREARDLRLTPVGLRLLSYGERMLENDGRVVSNFVVQALRGQELTVYGAGTQTRSFCYVSDLVDGIIRLMNAEAADIHMPVNIGNPGEFTMNELAEQVGKCVGREIKIRYLPLPQDDPKQRQPNIDRAKALLGWQPKVPLAEGLKKTVDYFRELIESTSQTASNIKA